MSVYQMALGYFIIPSSMSVCMYVKLVSYTLWENSKKKSYHTEWIHNSQLDYKWKQLEQWVMTK